MGELSEIVVHPKLAPFPFIETLFTFSETNSLQEQGWPENLAGSST
jgi:hypothetical protein